VQANVHVQPGRASPSTAFVVRAIWRGGGFRAFYAGLDSTIMRDVPFSALQLLLLEQGKRAYERAHDGERSPPWAVATMGGFSGGFAAALTTPLDVIKTRLMTQLPSRRAAVAAAAASSASTLPVASSPATVVCTAPAPVPYTGARDAFARIVREEGWRALFLGLQPRITWISIGGALFFGAYDVCCNTLVKWQAEDGGDGTRKALK
jgi:solute carrier family 25 S-adenosylmethionine transporter 26